MRVLTLVVFSCFFLFSTRVYFDRVSLSQQSRRYVDASLISEKTVTTGFAWRLAVVLAADKNYVNSKKHGKDLLMRWKLYCGIHGYTFINIDNFDW